MILVVDIGNSNIVLGILDQKRVIFTERIVTKKREVYESTKWFYDMLNIHNIVLDKIEGSIISSVVPNITEDIKTSLQRILNKEPIVICSDIKINLERKMDRSEELGADLIATAIAGIREYKAPMLIFDLGTATTCSIIDKDKVFIGGIIIPGIEISQKALFEHAAQLSDVSYKEPKSIIAKNTEDCIRGGIVYGSSSMIDGIIERIEEELGSKVTTIITGGLARNIVGFCKKEVIYDNDLLLRGLGYIYEENSRDMNM